MTPLIDATEMYLRTIWELEEEGITPIRARLVERLHLSAPAVSETVQRLEGEGLLRMDEDRTLRLTEVGRDLAVSVMRKHRLAELLLTEVIGLEWEHVHAEACRWEHVISDRVEERLIELLDKPTVCPHGNPIPGIGLEVDDEELVTMHTAAKAGSRVTVKRISELVQSDIEVMRHLHDRGLVPGAVVELGLEGGVVTAALDGSVIEVECELADHLHVATDPTT